MSSTTVVIYTHTLNMLNSHPRDCPSIKHAVYSPQFTSREKNKTKKHNIIPGRVMAGCLVLYRNADKLFISQIASGGLELFV